MKLQRLVRLMLASRYEPNRAVVYLRCPLSASGYGVPAMPRRDWATRDVAWRRAGGGRLEWHVKTCDRAALWATAKLLRRAAQHARSRGVAKARWTMPEATVRDRSEW